MLLLFIEIIFCITICYFIYLYLHPSSLKFPITNKGYYHIPITIITDENNVLDAIFYASSIKSISIILGSNVFPIQQIRSICLENNIINLHFDPPTKQLIQPIQFKASDADIDCIYQLLNNPSKPTTNDSFNLIVDRLSVGLPSFLTSVSPTVLFINIDLSLLNPLFDELHNFDTTDYTNATSYEFDITVTTNTPITIYLDGTILSPFIHAERTFYVKYLVSLSGILRIKVLHYPCKCLYIGLHKNPIVIGQFSLMSEHHWVKKYAFRYIMNVVQLVKNQILKDITIPNTFCCPLYEDYKT
ncbi:hypothetical protein QTN25_005537 [Entamoeba marina]